ncbi:HAMP domain-containing protein [Methylobacterium sp. R2-1]|nr:HAMP domain-containing protein [Methylobacterium sp. R2-1]
MVVAAAGSDGQIWHYIASPIRASETADRWAMVVAVPSATLSAAADHARTILIISAILCILASCGALVVLVRRLVGTPARALASSINGMANGDYGAAVPEAKRRDELGLVGQAVIRLRDSLRRSVETEAEQRALRLRRSPAT